MDLHAAVCLPAQALAVPSCCLLSPFNQPRASPPDTTQSAGAQRSAATMSARGSGAPPSAPCWPPCLPPPRPPPLPPLAQRCPTRCCTPRGAQGGARASARAARALSRQQRRRESGRRRRAAPLAWWTRRRCCRARRLRRCARSGGTSGRTGSSSPPGWGALPCLPAVVPLVLAPLFGGCIAWTHVGRQAASLLCQPAIHCTAPHAHPRLLHCTLPAAAGWPPTAPSACCCGAWCRGGRKA